MKKTNIFIILLLIWNIVLTFFVFYTKETNTTVTEENVSGFSTDLTKVAEAGSSSIVVVDSTYGTQSGFIYKQQDDNAYVITTFHGIGKDNTVSVTLLNGKTFVGDVVGFDYVTDIAILSIETPYKLNVVKCGDNEYLKEGEFIINIGSSITKDYISDIKLGIISNSLVNLNDNIEYNKEKYSINKDVVAVSLNVVEGSSGSPIFNMNNEVVGIVEMSNDKEGIYAITINEAKIVADLIISGKEVSKFNLGIGGEYIKTLKDYERNIYDLPLDVINGYYVRKVDLNSVASKLGVINGDVILSINGKVINTQKDYLNILYGDVNDELVLSVIRNNENIELKGSIND